MKRIPAVTRLHFATGFGTFVLPAIIIGGILVVNILLWLVLRLAVSPGDYADVNDGVQYSGASFYIFVQMMIFAVQSIATTFPFAQGYGVTRRSYWTGTALAYVILSVFWAAVLTVLGGIEELTGGWGLHGTMFTAVYFGEGPWWSRFAVFFPLMVFSFFVGSMFAAIFVRWRATGLVTSFLAILLVLVGAIALVIVTRTGDALYRVIFFAPLPGGGNSGLEWLWVLPVAALAALIGFLVLRRATARS